MRPMVLNVLISDCELFVSVLALAVTIDSGRATRVHNRLSVRPHIILGYFANDEGAGWTITSNGAGPAIVNVFEVTVDSRPVQTWEGVLLALGIVPQKSTYLEASV